MSSRSVLRLSKQDLVNYLKEILKKEGDIKLTVNDTTITIGTNAASVNHVDTQLNSINTALVLKIDTVESELSQDLNDLESSLTLEIQNNDTRQTNIINEIQDYLQLKTSNIDNTSDLNKPISNATQSALNTKQENLVNQTNIRSLNNQSLLGNGNLVIDKAFVGLANVDDTSDLNKPISTATQTALNNLNTQTTTSITQTNTNLTNTTADLTAQINTKANKTTTINGKPLENNIVLVAADFALGNVDNTRDVDKAISTATQNALNAKQNTLVNQTNIRSLNNQSLLGSGNLTIDRVFVGLNKVDNTNDFEKPISIATNAVLITKEEMTRKGQANGYASLDNNAKVPKNQVPLLDFDHLENVQINAPLSDNQLLTWNNAQQKWQNMNPPAPADTIDVGTMIVYPRKESTLVNVPQYHVMGPIWVSAPNFSTIVTPNPQINHGWFRSSPTDQAVILTLTKPSRIGLDIQVFWGGVATNFQQTTRTSIATRVGGAFTTLDTRQVISGGTTTNTRYQTNMNLLPGEYLIRLTVSTNGTGNKVDFINYNFGKIEYDVPSKYAPCTSTLGGTVTYPVLNGLIGQDYVTIANPNEITMLPNFTGPDPARTYYIMKYA